MTFNWNADTIRWYQAANEYTGFFHHLAQMILPAVEGSRTFCDMGCGLGLIDLELAPMLKRIDCVDKSAAALAALRESIYKRKIMNIHPHHIDCDEVNACWDVVFMSFFGSRNPDRFLPRCRKLIAVVGGAGQCEMIPPKHRKFRKNTLENTERYLSARGICYRLTLEELEFGQPFSSMDDARAFVLCHTPESTPDEVERFLERRLSPTGRADYPFFLSRIKSYGIFEMDCMPTYSQFTGNLFAATMAV